jgi:hypothetical protein
MGNNGLVLSSAGLVNSKFPQGYGRISRASKLGGGVVSQKPSKFLRHFNSIGWAAIAPNTPDMMRHQIFPKVLEAIRRQFRITGVVC